MIPSNNFLFLPALRFPPSIFPFPVHPSLTNSNFSNISSDPSPRKEQFVKSINLIPFVGEDFWIHWCLLFSRDIAPRDIFYFLQNKRTYYLLVNICGKLVVTLLISSIISTQLAHTQNQSFALLSSRYNDFLNPCFLEILLLKRPNSLQRETYFSFNWLHKLWVATKKKTGDFEIVLKIASES